MDLNGRWLVSVSTDELRRSMAEPAFDDSGWFEAPVPGHWRSTSGLAATDGPVLYRRSFEGPPVVAGHRYFLTFDGIFYQGDVWFDGEYLGVTEGYFAPHTFEVTEKMGERSDHVLAVEVTCTPPEELKSKRNLTGVFQHWDCIDSDWNPGGIWAPVHIDETGPVRISSLKVLCPEANPERAVVDLEAALDTLEPFAVMLTTTVTKEADDSTAAEENHEHHLGAGRNVVRWRVVIERPDLWWPRALGEQPLHVIRVEVRPMAEAAGEDEDRGPEGPDDGSQGDGSQGDGSQGDGSLGGGYQGDGSQGDGSAGYVGVAPSGRRAGPPPMLPSDARRVLTGLRQIRFRDFVATANGERLFLKGVNCGPTRAGLADATPAAVAADVELAAEAGFDLIRVHAHISRPELYEAADRLGVLVWQDLPLQWGYGQVRRQAVAQAREAVTLLGHHPSIALWCGHNEPMALEVGPGKMFTPATVARFVAAQALPSWNKSALDRSIRRALERADPSREVVADSGVLPHPAWGTDSHFYFGWYHGEERDLPSTLARFPVLARFVSEFGAQAIPESAAFMHPESWPDLDWDHLEAHHCYQRSIFEQRVPPASFPTFDAWRRASQDYQSTLLRHHVETLRRLKYRPTGGFCVFLLADAQPAVTWSLLDHDRVPKSGYKAVAAACAPVIVTADRPDPSYHPGQRFEVDLHAVSDLRVSVDQVKATAVLRWPGGSVAGASGETSPRTAARVSANWDTSFPATPERARSISIWRCPGPRAWRPTGTHRGS